MRRTAASDPDVAVGALVAASELAVRSGSGAALGRLLPLFDGSGTASARAALARVRVVAVTLEGRLTAAREACGPALALARAAGPAETRAALRAAIRAAGLDRAWANGLRAELAELEPRRADRVSIDLARVQEMEASEAGTARELLSGALAHAESTEDSSLIARVYLRRAVVEQQCAQPEAARLDLERALAAAHAAEDRPMALQILLVAGDYAYQAGRTAESLELAEQQRVLAGHIGARDVVSEAHVALATRLLTTGRHAEARAHLDAALATAVDLGHPKLAQRALMSLANLSSIEGDAAAAERLYSRALDHARQLDDDENLAIVIGNLGIVRAKVGMNAGAGAESGAWLAKARRDFEEALEIHERRGVRRPQGFWWSGLSRVALFEGRVADAVACAEQAVAVSVGFPLLQLDARLDLINALHAVGQPSGPGRSCRRRKRSAKGSATCFTERGSPHRAWSRRCARAIATRRARRIAGCTTRSPPVAHPTATASWCARATRGERCRPTPRRRLPPLPWERAVTPR